MMLGSSWYSTSVRSQVEHFQEDDEEDDEDDEEEKDDPLGEDPLEELEVMLWKRKLNLVGTNRVSFSFLSDSTFFSKARFRRSDRA